MRAELGTVKTNGLAATAIFALAFLAIYFATTAVGLFLHGAYAGLTPLWPASAISLYLLHARGLSWCLLIVVGELLVALWLGQPLTMGLIGGVLQALEAAIALRFLRGLPSGALFSNVPQTLRFAVYVCLLPPLVSASGGALTQLAHGLIQWQELGSAALTWWLGDAMALLVIVPFLLTWWPLPQWSWTDFSRWASIVGLQLLVGAALTRIPKDRADVLFFLLLPFVGWLALRFRAAGATSAALALAAIVFGLHSAKDPFTTGVHIAFVGVSALAGYILAALLARRDAVLATLTHQADHDVVTGLFNRSRVERALRDLHHDGADRTAGHVLLHVDLDHFKLVNDTCGHERADILLGDLGRQIERELPPDALVGRLGGDEYLVLVRNHEGDPQYLAETVRQGILRFGFDCAGRSFSLGASIGVAPFESTDSPPTVISRADLARQAAKREGGNRSHVFARADVSLQRHRSELAWTTDIEHAIERGDLTLFAQRIAPVAADGNPPYVEVLLRKYENGEPTSPAQFLPGASRYGLMPMIDRWVVRTCFEQLAAAPDSALRLSINLAAETVDRPDFLDFVEQLTGELNMDPTRICFEVTERVAIRNVARATESMRRLKSLGYAFALDDFGAGVANFGYLNQLPVDFIKIDGQFIRGVVDDESSRIIVACVRDLARAHGMRCIAEFVESRGILDAVAALGIDYAQGFHIHRPEPLAHLLGQTVSRTESRRR